VEGSVRGEKWVAEVGDEFSPADISIFAEPEEAMLTRLRAAEVAGCPLGADQFVNATRMPGAAPLAATEATASESEDDLFA
jgi:hypothetical protein